MNYAVRKRQEGNKIKLHVFFMHVSATSDTTIAKHVMIEDKAIRKQELCVCLHNTTHKNAIYIFNKTPFNIRHETFCRLHEYIYAVSNFA